MPLPKGTRYRMKDTGKGKVRLAFGPGDKGVIEAKNMKTGATHERAEFAADRKKRKGRAHTMSRRG